MGHLFVFSLECFETSANQFQLLSFSSNWLKETPLNRLSLVSLAKGGKYLCMYLTAFSH